MPAHHFVQRSIQAAGSKGFAGLGNLPAIPPICAVIVEDILLAGVDRAEIRRLFTLLALSQLFFF
ncbi:MAG TPA: hypothetical protein VMT46_06885 [Anaerolineaceae bacterium]|nr:hypothetical protein [Anaerolineaceae bacterium]